MAIIVLATIEANLASGITVTNFSFESPNVSGWPNPWTSGGNGDSNAIPGWTITTGSGNAGVQAGGAAAEGSQYAYVGSPGGFTYVTTTDPVVTIADNQIYTLTVAAKANLGSAVPSDGVISLLANRNAGIFGGGVVAADVGNGAHGYIGRSLNGSVLNSGFTFDGWFKTVNPGTGKVRYLGGFDSSGAGGDLFYVRLSGSATQTGGCTFGILDLPSYVEHSVTTTNLVVFDGNWHQVAVSYAGATLKVYLDNVLVASQSAAPSLNFAAGTFSVAGNAPWAPSAAGAGTFAGSIDEVRLSKTALTNFDSGGVQYATNANTVLLWHLNDGSGTIADDATANNLDGAVYLTPNLSWSAPGGNVVASTLVPWNGNFSDYSVTFNSGTAYSGQGLKIRFGISSAPGNSQRFFDNVRLTSTAQTFEPFGLSVYLSGINHEANLDPSRMLADLASLGCTRVVLNSFIYSQWVPLQFNQLAKDWGIDVCIGGIVLCDVFNPATPPTGTNIVDPVKWSQALSDFDALKAFVDNQPDADAVKAWYLLDEIEAYISPTKLPQAQQVLRNLVGYVKAADPGRKTLINHDFRRSAWGGSFLWPGEDETWCSTFFHNSYASAALAGIVSDLKSINPSGKATCVFGAQGVQDFSTQQMLSDYEMVGLTVAGAQARSAYIDIQDYLLTSYNVGASGAALFCYDGYYDFQYYTVATERGESKTQKMEAVRLAMNQIAAMEKRPTTTLGVTWTNGQNGVTVSVSTAAAAGGATVTNLTVQVSVDGGYTWETLGGFGLSGGQVNYDFSTQRWQSKELTMVRARCQAGGRYSLWQVFNAFPVSPVSAIGSYDGFYRVDDPNNPPMLVTNALANWRQQYFGTTANTGAAADTADPDGDGLNNAQEYLWGTVPITAEPGPIMTVTLSGSNMMVFTFVARLASGTGYEGLTRFYALESSVDLANPPAWGPVAGYENITGANQTVTITQPMSGTQRFFRLKAWLQ
jgi:hypothetical protein